LEPLSGYITLTYYLQKNVKINGESFNFGPKLHEIATVKKVLQISKKYWNNAQFKIYKQDLLKEDHLLKLNSLKAKKVLKWEKILSLEKTIELTMNWYNKFYQNNVKVKELLDNDIDYYLNLKKVFNN
jgi:CDP-glucose 4,6-dehydratase